MIVVLGDEEEVVDHAHGLGETWMKGRAIQVGLPQCLEPLDRGEASAPERGQEVLERPLVVPSLVRFRRQVSHALFETCGSATNALENVRERLPREPELESAIEPAPAWRGMDFARAHRVIDGPIRP